MGDDVEKILVFQGKIIRYFKGDAKGKLRAINYSKEIGIPESQVDWNE